MNQIRLFLRAVISVEMVCKIVTVVKNTVLEMLTKTISFLNNLQEEPEEVVDITVTADLEGNLSADATHCNEETEVQDTPLMRVALAIAIPYLVFLVGSLIEIVKTVSPDHVAYVTFTII